MRRDFTLDVYRTLCKTLKNSGYETITLEDYILKRYGKRFVILRHDVDKNPENALAMAKIENGLGMRSTYYFRTIDGVFRPDIMKEIMKLKHEIGYHYEVLDRANGNHKMAIKLFEKELRTFREIYDVKTICMHGNPWTPWLNKDLWKHYDFKDFGIIGDAYLSLNPKDVLYFTDTGRAWNGKYSVKDSMDVKNKYADSVKDTGDLIVLIRKNEIRRTCILTHPQRWNDPFYPWFRELMLQSAKNVPKGVIKCLR